MNKKSGMIQKHTTMQKVREKGMHGKVRTPSPVTARKKKKKKKKG